MSGREFQSQRRTCTHSTLHPASFLLLWWAQFLQQLQEGGEHRALKCLAELADKSSLGLRSQRPILPSNCMKAQIPLPSRTEASNETVGSGEHAHVSLGQTAGLCHWRGLSCCRLNYRWGPSGHAGSSLTWWTFLLWIIMKWHVPRQKIRIQKGGLRQASEGILRLFQVSLLGLKYEERRNALKDSGW